MKIRLAYGENEQGRADEIVKLLRTLCPALKLKESGERDGYWHIYAEIPKRFRNEDHCKNG